MSVRKLLALSTLFLASNGSVAVSPVPPPAIPPDVRLTIGVKNAGLLEVYRTFERVATRAQFICHPTMKDYESWRANGFEPMRRDMVCVDSRNDLIDGSWESVTPESITIDIRVVSTEEVSKSRIDQLVAELQKSLKADRSVMTVMQDIWSPEHSRSIIK
jgi:hypothetical protein